MTTIATTSRPFSPGTTGWTARDLDDPDIERLWFDGRYEIIDGVLTTMPPAYFLGMQPLQELVFILKSYLKERNLPDYFSGEADIVIDEDRVVRADAVWTTKDDLKRQRQARLDAGKTDPVRTRILVPPTLIIESVSPGHERHDEHTKRRWYAEFRVPNYWILNTFLRSLKCFVLEGDDYRIDAEGRESDQIHSSLFPDLVVPLSRLWLDLG